MKVKKELKDKLPLKIKQTGQSVNTMIPVGPLYTDMDYDGNRIVKAKLHSVSILKGKNNGK